MLETRETEKKLFDAFSALVLEEHATVDRISVTGITAKAGMNRRTFYTHFEDMYDLYRQFKKWMIADLAAQLEYSISQGVRAGRQMIEDSLDYLVARRSYALAIAQLDPSFFPNEVANFVGKALMVSLDSMKTEDQKGISDSEVKYQAYFLSDASCWIGYRWLKAGMDAPKAELVDVIYGHVLLALSQILGTNFNELVD